MAIRLMFRFTENALDHFCDAIGWFCSDYNDSFSDQPEMQIVAKLVYPAMNDGTPVEVGVYVPEELSDTVQQQIIDFVMTSYKQDYDRNYARPYTNNRSFKYELMFLGQEYDEHPNSRMQTPPVPSLQFPPFDSWRNRYPNLPSNIQTEQEAEQYMRRVATHIDQYGSPTAFPPGPFTPPDPFARPNPFAPPPNPFAPPNPFKK